MYTVCVIANLVPAGHAIITMIGRYHIYVVFVIAHLVFASHANITLVGRYHIMDIGISKPWAFYTSL
jgi:hypothetical protein